MNKEKVNQYTHNMFKAWNAAFMQGVAENGIHKLGGCKVKKPKAYKQERERAHSKMNNMDSNGAYSHFVNTSLNNYLGGNNND